MYKKRTTGELDGRLDFSSSTSPTNLEDNIHYLQRKALVSYIISHASDDQRPYLEVSIMGHLFLGLLDSGSSATLVSQKGFETLKFLGLTLDDGKRITCSVANGQRCSSIGFVKTPICLMGKVCVIDVVVVPELSNNLILGTDFWMAMDIIPNLKENVWHFGSPELKVAGVVSEGNLSIEQRIQLDGMLNEKFSKMGTGLGFTSATCHEIILEENTRPIKQRYYPVSPYKQKIIDDEITKMLELGVIEPSKSAWSSPILLVPKGDQTYRFCVDYRALNKVTKKDAYPLPYVSAILDRLRGARYLSALDIKSAYWQIGVKEECREYTAFTVPNRGLYQFKRMPFGLTNAPATWQRFIDNVLGADLENYVMVYLDDIICFAPDLDTHLRILAEVFDRLTKAGLTLSREKCKFCLPSLLYLGYKVDEKGLHVDVSKVEAILKLRSPRNSTEVRRFIGMTGWYRKFIPNFSTLIAPLTRLIQKNFSFTWTQECDDAFNKIKNILISAPILTCPDFSQPFTLQTDASAYGLGAVLTQNLDGEEKVICFLSRSLTKAERNWSTTERECIAVIWAVEKLRHYLDLVPFTIVTDHASLLWLDRLKDPTGRLARWALRLQPFNYTIVHRKGRENIVADFLSRSVPVSVEAVGIGDDSLDFSNSSDKWYEQMRHNIVNKPQKYPQWRVENGMIYKYVKCAIPELSKPSDDWKLVVPKDKRKQLISNHHDDVRSGHVGSYKTYWKIQQRFTWPKMRADVNKYVRSCQTCAHHKPEQKAAAGFMGTRPTIDKPWQMISLDFMGPYPRSKNGYSYLLTVCDYFSKYVVLCPMRTATSKALCQFVENQIFCVYGVPQFLICDNGVQMRSKNFQALCDTYHTKICYTANYHPNADPAERYNKIVKTMIASYLSSNHKEWDKNIASIGCAIRTSKSETTGFTPFFINFGREYIGDGRYYKIHGEDFSLDQQTLTGDLVKKRQEGFKKLFEDVKGKLAKAQERYRKYYNLRRRPVQYSIGERVWRKNKVTSDASKSFNAKLSPKYIGPFVIKMKIGSCSYELLDSAGKPAGVWHVQDLKPVNFDSDED